MKSVFVADLKVGDAIDKEVFGIAECTSNSDKLGRPYCDLVLVDRSGQIKAKLWSDLLAKIGRSSFDCGQMVSCTAAVQEFRGVKQLVVSGLEIVEVEDIAWEDFLPASQFTLAELEQRLTKELSEISDDFLRTLSLQFFTAHKAEILAAPAAKQNHHNFRGGLVEHLLEMMGLAKATANYYPEASLDIVIAGIFWHDLGKVEELEYSNFAIRYTKKGKLLGHISIGVELLHRFLEKQFSQLTPVELEKVILLEHIILSHHGVLEWGSPVTPRTLEAIIVSKVDEVSSQARFYQRVLTENRTSENDFSGYVDKLGGEIYLRSQSLMEMESEKKKSGQGQVVMKDRSQTTIF